MAQIPIQQNVNLKEWNSWRVGGSAEFFCTPKTKTELLQSLQWAKQNSMPYSLLGGGTNVLISDKGVKGLLINLHYLRGLQEKQEQGYLYISALAGVPKADLMKIFVHHKLAPSLFLCGLPGDVGGGVVMNAGVGETPEKGREFKDIVHWVKVIRGTDTVHIPTEEIKWKYRSSTGWQPGIIYEIGMKWPMQAIKNLPQLLKQTALKRARTQPLQSASCGSVFKNPKSGQKAGALIEKCGLKKHSIGHAQVSEKHANFIVNTGGTTAQDIHQLIQFIQQTVFSQEKILLEPEVQYLGIW